MSTCEWPLGNGESLDFTIYGPNTTWHPVPGIFIFTCMNKEKIWCALYIEQTENFSLRIPEHELIDEAVQAGATHIHALVVQEAADREKWAKMLIEHLQPPLNR
jgi:hypothetical protein